MLTMTETAAEAVRTIVANTPDASDGGVRISDAGERGYELSLVPAPAPQDTVIDDHGARVYLDEPSTAALDDRILDARPQENGEVRFALAQRS